MRHEGFHRGSTVLALVAVLLLALLPSIGRMAQAADGATDGRVQLCTASGLQWVDLHPAGRPDGSPHGGMPGGDCAYCPLLASLVAASVPLLQVPLLGAPSTPSWSACPTMPPLAIRRGLGSRGPPGVA